MADINKICAAIGRYYDSLDQAYDGLFSAYCDENGVEELEDELAEGWTDSLLSDFEDGNFPFKVEPKSDEEKKQFVFELIQKCAGDPDIIFVSSIPDFKEDGDSLFKLEEKELDVIKKTYREQCPTIYTQEWELDKGLLTLLAVGKKKGFDYLMHLVDDFNRWRVDNMSKNSKDFKSTSNWIKNHRHFIQLQNVNVGGKSYGDMATSAVNSFNKRVCPKLEFSSGLCIDDSLERTAHYICDASTFVWSLVETANKSKTGLCPFQMDFCIISGAPASRVKKEDADVDDDDDDDDEDPDDDDEEKAKDDGNFKDIIGSMEKRLKGVKHKHVQSKEGDAEPRKFGNLYRGLLADHKLKSDDEKYEYLHKKRFVATIDRRVSKENKDEGDDIYMYEATHSNVVPNDEVPESYIDASLCSVLPVDPGEPDEGDIGAKNGCNGYTLTLSFHAKEEKEIKCYLFWSGQMIRFMPEDMKTLLPSIFNMEFTGNQDFVNGKELDVMIGDMKKKIVDQQFQAFVSSYK